MSETDRLKPKAVLFDLGSTLIEYEVVPWDELGEECVAEAYRELTSTGIELPDEKSFSEKYRKVRDSLRKKAVDHMIEWSVPEAAAKLFEELGISADDSLADRFFEAYYRPVKEKLYIYDDTVETLKSIRNRYSVVGLISNTIFPEETHLDELKRFKIDSFFDFTIFSSSFGLRKPHPDIFGKAANLAGFAPSEIVYVGDRYLEDIEGPASIGMPAILKVKEGRDYPAEMPAATRRIDVLAELADHIEIDVD